MNGSCMHKRYGRRRSAFSMLLALLLVLQLWGAAGYAAAFEEPVSYSSQPETVTHVVYVNGSGSGLQDGSSPDHAFASLSQAYAGFAAGLEEGETAVILISGPVSLQDDTGLSHPSGKADQFALPAHDGTVILTSKYGDADYTGAGSLGLNVNILHLMGDTRIENIAITATLNILMANFHALHMGAGITASTPNQVVIKEIYGATNSAVGMAAALDHTSITIDSGKYTIIYGGGSSWQGVTARAKDYDTGIIINGGNVSTIYGTGQGNTDNAHQRNVTIVQNGGTVGRIFGAHKDGTVYGLVRIDLNQGTLTTAVYGGDKYTRPSSGSNEAFTPTLYGGVEIRLRPEASVPQIYGAAEGANVAGKRVLEAVGFGSEAALATFVPAVSNVDSLALKSSHLQLGNDREAFWNGLGGLRLTDDSSLRLAFIPPVREEGMGLEVQKQGADYAWDRVLITAPCGTGPLFHLKLPLNGQLEYEPGASSPSSPASWRLTDAGLAVGQQGVDGVPLDVELGLPSAYSAVIDGETVFERYQQRLAELGAASQSAQVIAPAAIQGAIELYVAPSGNDNAPGTIVAPLRTLGKALDYVAALQSSVHPKGIVVYLREGTYLTQASINLGEQHSGTDEAPVVISAYPGETVRFSGGAEVAGSQFAAVADEAVRQRLNPAAREHIVVADLQALGITDYGTIQAGSTGGPTYQVYVDGEAQRLARYPNASTLSLGQVLDIGPVTANYSTFPQGTNLQSTGIEYVMQDLRPLSWLQTNDIWIKGALYAEWNIQNHQVSAIKSSTNSVKLVGGTSLGAISGLKQTYYYYNVLEELDVPGEYYLDREQGKLYLYAPGNMSQTKVTLSLAQHDLFRLQGTRNLVLNGLTVDYGGGNGIVLEGNCYKTLVQNSTIRHISKTGMVISGKHSGLIHSTVEYTGSHPASITDDGRYFDYTPDSNFVQNNYMHHTGTLNPKFGYLILNGVGNVISHNLIQNTFSVSIYNQRARESIVEYNEIVGGPTGTFDGASIYAVGFPISRGNHYRYNYIHDVFISGDSANPHGIYFDEMSSENYAYGNLMVNVPSGFFTNSGGNNVVVNNVVMEGRSKSHASIYAQSNFGTYTLPQWLSRSTVLKETHQAYVNMSGTEKNRLRSRNPGLTGYYDDVTEVLAERAAQGDSYVITDKEKLLVTSNHNYFVGNISYGHKGVIADGLYHTTGPNLVTDQDPFVDSGNGNFNLKPGINPGFAYAPLPFEQMGRTGAKQGIGSFKLTAPLNGSQSEVYSGEVLLQWSPAAGADYYMLTIAQDAAMTVNARTIKSEPNFFLAQNDAYFAYGQTYYWKVTAYTSAVSRLAGEVPGDGVHSFTTMTEAEYLELHRANALRLEEAIAGAWQLFDSMTEGAAPGQYAPGAKDELAQDIASAEAILAGAAGKLQEEVDAAAYGLNQAVLNAITQQRIAYVSLGTANTSDWQETADAIPSRITSTVEGDALQFQASGSRSEMVLKQKQGQREILLLNYRQEGMSSWNGFALRQSGLGAISSSTGVDSYSIVVKSDQFELQKRKNGASFGNIAVAANNGRMLPGQWYKLELGAVNRPGGQVQILFKINDEVIFDYLDAADPILEQGHFGIIVQPVHGATSLKAVPLAGPTAVDSAVYGQEDMTLFLAVTDFVYSSGLGYSLERIRLTGLPEHGRLLLGDSPATVSQEVYATDIPMLRFIPDADWHGVTTLAWQGSDGLQYSAVPAAVLIHIAAVNDPPQAHAGSITVTSGQSAAGVLHGTDADGDSLHYTITVQPSRGTVSLTDATTGNYVYTAPAGAEGNDSFAFRVYDGTEESNEAEIAVTILPAGSESEPQEPDSQEQDSQEPDPQEPGQRGAGAEQAPSPVQPQSVSDIGGKVIVIEDEGWVSASVSVDQERLEAALKAEVAGKVLTLTVAEHADEAVAELDGRMMERLADAEAVLELQTPGAAYRLPAAMLDAGRIGELLGMDEEEAQQVVVRIRIMQPAEEQTEQVQAAARKQSVQLVIQPVWFSVELTHQNHRFVVEQYDGYAEGMVAIPGGVPAGMVAAGVAVEQDGSLRHIPTLLVTNNGITHAVIRSQGSGWYAVVASFPQSFRDMTGHWAAETVGELAARLIVNGADEGLFQPDRSLTRAEWATLLVRSLGLRLQETPQADPGFHDIPASGWSRSAVDTAIAHHLMQGYGDGSFRPDAPVSREEAMTVLVRAMKLTGLSKQSVPVPVAAESASASYKDASRISDWAVQAVEECLKRGMVAGRSPEELAPQAPVTRAEAAVMMKRLLQQPGFIE